MRKILFTAFTILALSACSKQENTPPPAPQQISDSAVGHYCSMNLTEHNGPKAQIFLNGKPDKPVWFSTIKQMFMGAEDALPFADKAQAEKFSKEKGGRVVGFAEMPDEYIFK